MNYITSDDLAAYAAGNVKAMDIWDLYMEDTARITAACTQATAIIDSLNYVGRPSSPDNAFPRIGQSEIPDSVISAACEIALALLDGIDPEQDAESQAITSVSIDGVRTTYDRTTRDLHILAGVPSRVAWGLLAPWIQDTRSIITSRV